MSADDGYSLGDARRWLRRSWPVIAALPALIVLMALVGACCPRSHVASRSIELNASPQVVRQVVGDFGNQPLWRPSLSKVERTSDVPEVWREWSGRHFLDLKTIGPGNSESLVREIVGEGLPFTGRWEYQFKPGPKGGTTLAVTERGEVPNPVIRFMFTFFMDPSEQLKAYLNDLAKRVDEINAMSKPTAFDR